MTDLNSTITSITVPSTSITALHKFVKGLNRKATRMGLSPLSVSLGDKYTTLQTVEFEGKSFKNEIEVIDVAINGDIPTFKGWSFGASVEALDSGESIFHSAGEGVAIPERFKTSGHACEHCNQNRKRLKSFILSHVSGDFKQVGSTCIQDFLGGISFSAFSFVDTLFIQVKSFVDEEFESFGRNHGLYVERALAYACEAIATGGFVKVGGYDGYGRRPTAYVVGHAMGEREEIADGSLEKAKLVKAFFATRETSGNDYMDKLTALCKASFCEERNLNILVSAVAAYDRAIADKVNEASNSSTYLGVVGKRMTFDVTLISEHVLPDYGYGSPSLYRFEDKDGNVIMWKSSTDKDITNGDNFKLTGTVKEHKEWKGVKQTFLTRCKLA